MSKLSEWELKNHATGVEKEVLTFPRNGSGSLSEDTNRFTAMRFIHASNKIFVGFIHSQFKDNCDVCPTGKYGNDAFTHRINEDESFFFNF